MGKQEKPKLSIKNQIEKLKQKGVKFEIFNEDKATKFLQNNSYLFKVKAYCNTYKQKDKDGKTLSYQNLDFAYLVDLSTIDMHLRRFIIRLTLDMEHILKTKLMRDFNNSASDGYDIVAEFLKKDSYVDNFIDEQIKKSSKPMTPAQFILRDYKKEDLAIWNFIEVIQFGHFINFAKFFYEKYTNDDFNKIKDSLFNIKCIRNACAHNNCILADLKDNISQPQRQTIDKIFNKKIFKNLTPKGISNNLKNQTINDFITLLFVYDEICKSKDMKKYCYIELVELLTKRLLRNKVFYKNNILIKARFRFCTRIINYLK